MLSAKRATAFICVVIFAMSAAAVGIPMIGEIELCSSPSPPGILGWDTL